MTTRTLTTNASWALCSHLFSRGAVIVASILLARELATPMFAAYSYFQLTVSMLAAYASLGLGVTASRYFAEVGHARSGQSRPPLGLLCLLSIVISCLVFVLVLLLPARWVTAELDVPQWLLAVAAAFTALNVVPAGAVLGLERYRDATAVSFVAGVCMLSAAWWSAAHHEAVTAMAGLAVAALIQATGQFAVAVRSAGWTSFHIDRSMLGRDLRQIYGFAGPMLVVTLMSASGAWLVGRIILHLTGGQHAFALYTIGLQWFGLALVVPGMISRVVLPRLVRTSQAAAGYTQKRLVRSGALLSVAAATGVAAVGTILGPYLMLLYGQSYQPGRWFIAAFMGAAVLCAPANTLGNAIVARDGQRSWLAATFVWLMVLLVAASATVDLGAWSGAIALGLAALALIASGLFIGRRRGLA